MCGVKKKKKEKKLIKALLSEFILAPCLQLRSNSINRRISYQTNKAYKILSFRHFIVLEFCKLFRISSVLALQKSGCT